jgi:hypothetical protein
MPDFRRLQLQYVEKVGGFQIQVEFLEIGIFDQVAQEPPHVLLSHGIRPFCGCLYQLVIPP